MKKTIKGFFRIKQMLRDFSAEADQALLENADMLEEGVWKAHGSLMLFYKKGYKKQCDTEAAGTYYARAIYEGLDGTTCLAKRLFSLFYRRKISGKNFNGQILMLSSSRSTTRFINISKGVLLTKYIDHSVMEERENNRCLLNDYYKTVPLIKIDNKMCYTVEQFIKKQACSDAEKFNHILQDYLTISESMNCRIINKKIADNEKKQILSKCKILSIEDIGARAIEWIESENYRCCLSHGDISPLNVMFDGRDYYYIDFENVAERVFFYDLIEYLSWCGCNKGYQLPICFLNGDYDGVFSAIFKNYGVLYEPDDRRVYLMIYAIERGWGRDLLPHIYDQLLALEL